MMRRGYADTPEGQVHYVSAGEGETLLLLHATPRSWRLYEKLIPLLAARYRVLAMDTLGCGNSAPLPPSVRIEDLASNVAHVLDALQVTRCHLLGIHTGAKVAGEVAAAWPSRVNRLVLFGYSLKDTSAESEKEVSQLVEGMARRVETSLDGSHLARWWWWAYRPLLAARWHTANGPLVSETPEVLDEMHSRFQDILQARHSAPAFYRAAFSYPAESRLPKIQAWTLVIQGTGLIEPKVSQHAQRVAALIKNSVAVTLEGADAYAPETRPQELADIVLGFLSRPQ